MVSALEQSCRNDFDELCVVTLTNYCGKVKKWLVENSWGDSKGKDGYFIMMDEWFDLYVQEVVVHKKYIPKDVMEVFKSKATILPAWVPMMERVK